MQNSLYILLLCTGLTRLATAQNNYVVNTSNANAPGANNTLIGPEAGQLGGTGVQNVVVGYQAGFNTFSGSLNVFVGAQAGKANQHGSANVFTGCMAGWNNTDGNSNTFVGNQSGIGNTTGSDNTFLGSFSGASNQTGSSNTFIGYDAGRNSTTASNNTFIGTRAGENNATGSFNTFIGLQAGQFNTTGSSNLMMGTNAGLRNTTGTGNFFLGDNAGSNTRSGSYNVFLGTNAGVGNDFGYNNMAIGFEANVSSGELVNATALGYRAFAATSNSLVLGSNANVGIGTSAPTAKLEVVSGVSGRAGLKLSSLTSSFVPGSSSNKFLTVDANGNVILATYASGGRVGDDLWQRKGNYLQTYGNEAVIIGQGISKTPLDYNLFVSKGILTEKVKVAVKHTDEWSDYVFGPSYRLQPLAEVEQHIQQYGHLPGVPSAQQMVTTGNDLHRTDVKLLEKIEELTLYLIALQKENQQQSAELADLKKQIATLIHK